jgi:Membrane bound O-acyl transferase family
MSLTDLPITSAASARSFIVLSWAFVLWVLPYAKPGSNVRMLPIFLLLLNVVLAVSVPNVFGDNAVAGALTGNAFFIQLLRGVQLLYLRKGIKTLTPSTGSKLSDADGETSPGLECRSGLKQQPLWSRYICPAPESLRWVHTFLNVREIGTSNSRRPIPSFSSTQSTYIPSRRQFIARHVVKLALCWLIIDCMSLQPKAPASLISPERERLFSRLMSISPGELVDRTLITAGFWTCSYLFLQLLHSTLALICVGLPPMSRYYGPADFPPLFGSVAEMYTVRRFWGVFWHQVLRSPLSANASAVIDALFPPSRWCGDASRRLVRRYARILAIFALSGVSHVVGAVAEGTGWGAWKGIMWFYTVNAGALIGEHAALELYRRTMHLQRQTENDPNSTGSWWRVLGYCWTSLWLVWCTPTYIYPGLRARQKAEIVPYSFARGSWVW